MIIKNIIGDNRYDGKREEKKRKKKKGKKWECD